MGSAASIASSRSSPAAAGAAPVQPGEGQAQRGGDLPADARPTSPRASRSAAGPGTAAGTRPAECRWPACKRLPAPAPAAARPVPRQLPRRRPVCVAGPAQQESRRHGRCRAPAPRGAWPRGQCGFWLVISTRPPPAGGRNRSTDARSGTLSKTSSHPAGPGQRRVHRTPPDSAASRPSRAPSCAASIANPPPAPSGPRPRNCQHHPDLGQVPVRVLHCHAGLPRAAQPAQRDQPAAPATRAAVSRASSSASSPSRPARTTGLGASRTGRPGGSGRRW